MKTTVLILAGAVAFDLGVVAVSAQAQQQATAPAGRAAHVPSNPNRSGDSGTIIQTPWLPPVPTPPGVEGSVSATKYIDKSEPVIFIKMDTVNTVRACEARRGEVVVHEGVQQCRLPAAEVPAGREPSLRGTSGDERGAMLGTVNGQHSDRESGPASMSAIDIFIKIDGVNNVRACLARRGEVVTHEGVQQCRLPPSETPAASAPTRRPGGIPPRN